MQYLVDVLFPTAALIHIVLDNLITHTPAALYQTFPPQEALRILSKLQFHYTPKHGSWLNMVELEFSALSRQCLNRRIPTIAQLQQQIEVWEQERNQNQATVNWRFSTVDARTKFKRLYPTPSLSYSLWQTTSTEIAITKNTCPHHRVTSFPDQAKPYLPYKLGHNLGCGK